MTEVLFGVLLQGLKLWNAKESSKYLDELNILQQEWRNEINQPRNLRDNDSIDRIEQRLHDLGNIFIASGKQNS